MYIDKLDDIVNKFSNTYQSTIKMKPVDVESSTYIDFGKKNNKENPKFQFLIMKEYQNTKAFCKSLHSKLIWTSFCD